MQLRAVITTHINTTPSNLAIYFGIFRANLPSTDTDIDHYSPFAVEKFRGKSIHHKTRPRRQLQADFDSESLNFAKS